MEDVPSNSANTQIIQIIYRLKNICEQFEQCQEQAERAKRYLIKERHFTPAQCKRATQFLVHLDTPTRDLCDLLKQIPLPTNIVLHSHSLRLILNSIEQEKSDLEADISEKGRQEQIITNVGVLGERLKQLVQELKETFEPLALPIPQTPPQETKNASPKSFVGTRKESVSVDFDLELGIHRLYELFKQKKRRPPSMLGVLEARLKENLRDRRIYGRDKANSADRAEILESLIELAADFGVNFNDLCRP